ncbi:hypothetical protein [Kitasatospora sp. NBC_01539]|uniref:hypothetical protein n=1 Tax=Kitasatospora sp. NBC_01539 TaxID=2903577 RepID=UPI0038601EED
MIPSDDTTEPGRTVRGLTLPPLLLGLIADGRWRHPGDAAVTAALPWFEDPLDLLTEIPEIRRHSHALDDLADLDLGPLYRQARGSTATGPVELPWLDIDRAVLVGLSRTAGDDTALALDYRTDPADPRVVASDVWTDPRAYVWRVAAPTLSSFAAALGLTPGPAPAAPGPTTPAAPGPAPGKPVRPR